MKRFALSATTAGLLLAGCGSPADDVAPDTMSLSESQALEDAGEMVEQRRTIEEPQADEAGTDEPDRDAAAGAALEAARGE